MAMKWNLVFLVAVAVLGYVCDAQWPKKPQPPIRRQTARPPIQIPQTPIVRPPSQKPSDPQKPHTPSFQRPPPQKPRETPLIPRPPPIEPPRPPIQKASEPGLPSKDTQEKTTWRPDLTWVYPPDPIPELTEKVVIVVERPPPANSVSAQCNVNMINVEVKMDMFGIGQLIRSADITMGGCAIQREDAQAGVLYFESALHLCGSTTRMSEDGDWLIYTFTLNYAPSALHGTICPIVRTGFAVVQIECYYPRKHHVMAGPLIPHWVPFSATKVAEELLYFTLKLMTDDLRHERPVNNYFLGDTIKFEASVFEYYHVPLRVYVDHCVISLTPETPNCRYDFIENYGCLVDAKLTGSKSRFLTRQYSNKLYFELEAFKFLTPDDGMAVGGAPKGGSDNTMRMKITCHLKASTDSHPTDQTHKACSYASGAWSESLGVPGVCDCCDSVCDATPDPREPIIGPPQDPQLPLPPQGPADPPPQYGYAPGGYTNPQRQTRSVKGDAVSEWEAEVSIIFTVGEVVAVDDVGTKGMD